MSLQAEYNFKKRFAIAGIHRDGILSNVSFESLWSNSALAYIFDKDGKTFQRNGPGSHRIDISNRRDEHIF